MAAAWVFLIPKLKAHGLPGTAQFLMRSPHQQPPHRAARAPKAISNPLLGEPGLAGIKKPPVTGAVGVRRFDSKTAEPWAALLPLYFRTIEDHR